MIFSLVLLFIGLFQKKSKWGLRTYFFERKKKKKKKKKPVIFRFAGVILEIESSLWQRYKKTFIKIRESHL